MPTKKIPLASENWGAAHPSILKGIIDANVGDAPPYGTDPWTAEAQKMIQEAFKRPCQVYFIPTGTGSNVLALKLACRRHESIICTDIAHINCQESGATEAILSCKLLTIPHHQGKATPEAVVKKLKTERILGKHATSPKVLSITQPTEIGTVYTLEELKALSELCQKENLFLHIDGSRLYNAAVSLNVTLDEMIKDVHVDVLSLGGTKNGLLGAEALLIFNPTLIEGSDYQQKQTLQLPSKMRFLAVQYIEFFKNELYSTLATQSNQKAQEIASIIRKVPSLSLSYPVDTNQLFFTAPISWIPLIQEKIACYLWNEERNELRLIASWDTSKQHIHDLESILLDISWSLDKNQGLRP